MISFTSMPLYPWGNNFITPMDNGLGGPHSQSGYHDERKMAFTGNQTPVSITGNNFTDTAWISIPKFNILLFSPINYIPMQKGTMTLLGYW
jgi:hypothetical protein